MVANVLQDDEDHYDRRNQRRRHNEAPPPARLRHQLIKIAESPLRRWGEEVQSIAALVSDNYDSDADLARTFVDLAMQLSVEQPLKTPFVAAVVLVANTREPKVAGDVLARLAKDTEESLEAGDWRKVKLRLKLLACLQSLLEGDGVFGVLEGLFARAADLQTASSEDVSLGFLTWGARTRLTKADHWYRDCQDHSLDYPVYPRLGTWPAVTAKGC